MVRILSAILALIVAGCATPMPPTGGQQQRTPPSIVSTTPEQGATLVDTREVRFDFNRFMSRGTAARAVRVEPDVGIPFKIDWRRRSMTITFERPLPDSVTVIVSLGTELADVENNRLSQPYQLAFSTGASVDSAGVDIATFSFDRVRGEEAATVGLFRGNDLGQAAVYVAESDTAGIVRFRYATPGLYRAVLFDDRNRNRKVDPDERHAFLPSDISVDSDSVRIAGTLVYAVQDTVSPSILGVGMLSSTRMRVRFSEAIRISRSSKVEAMSSASNQAGYWLYSDPSDPTIAFANTESPLIQGESYQLRTSGVSDLSGNLVAGVSTSFIASGQQDTTRMRLIRLPESTTVLQQDSIMIVYSKPVDASDVTDSLIVVDGETAVRGWRGLHVEQNRMYVYREGGWRSGQTYQIRVWDPMQGRHQPITVRPLDASELGAIEVVVDSTWAGQSVTIEILDDFGVVLRKVEFVDSIVLEGLVPGAVSVRAWVDLNRNGRWDQGRLVPSRIDSEPVFVQRGVPVTARMTSVVSVGTK